MTPLSHIECIKIQRPRKKPVFVKPTKVTHPELFPGSKICEIRPIDLLDRLNLELGIIKVIQPDRIHRLLGTTDHHPIQKTMMVMRIRKIMEHLHEYIMVERRQSVFTISEIVEETKKGSKKYRSILDVRDNTIMKPWKTANEKYGISIKEGNESYFHEMNLFTKNTYLSSDLQMLHLNTINGRLRFNKQESKYKINSDEERTLATCTFCRLADPNTVNIEDDRHLYVDCPISKEVLTQICTKFSIQPALTDESYALFFNTNDYWLKLKYNLIFLIYRQYINNCRRFGNLPCKNLAVQIITNKIKLVFACNPADTNLLDGLLPLLECEAIDQLDILNIINNSNNKDDKVTILYSAQRRTGLLATPALAYLSNNLATGTRTRNIQLWLLKLNQPNPPAIQHA